MNTGGVAGDVALTILAWNTTLDRRYYHEQLFRNRRIYLRDADWHRVLAGRAVGGVVVITRRGFIGTGLAALALATGLARTEVLYGGMLGGGMADALTFDDVQLALLHLAEMEMEMKMNPLYFVVPIGMAEEARAMLNGSDVIIIEQSRLSTHV